MHGAHHTYARVMSHTWMSHGTHMNASWHAYECVMTHIWMSHVNTQTKPHSITVWRRCIGCLKLQVSFRLKLQVSFHQRATYHRALLRKMTYKDKASYDATPPCTAWLEWMSQKNESLICVSWHAYKRVTRISHLNVCHGTYINESQERVIDMCVVAHINESHEWHAYERVTRMSHGSHKNEPWHTYLGHTNESRHTYKWVPRMTHTNDAFLWVMAHICASQELAMAHILSSHEWVTAHI